MPLSSFDITVVQRGELYHVSGNDAGKLHQKLQVLPTEAQNLSIGPLLDGGFTLKKQFALSDLPPVAEARSA